VTQAELDRVHMARCLELAAKYRGRTSPNPIVGSVIVDKRGKVIAEGAHAGPGKDHGERAALRKLRDRAAGATLYVNLEPCNHQGRTPPCAPLVRDSGVARVVIGAMDPITAHAGGAALLKKAKIKVTTGVLREECERANLPFFTWAREHRPAFTLKAAITLDGKIATVGGESKWITGEEARADVMRLRNGHDAILVGVGTVLADDPRLTARMKGGRDPIRIVLDRELRTPASAALLPRGAGPRTIFVAAEDASPSHAAALTEAGAEVWFLPPVAKGRPGLAELATRLGAEGITSVVVEGGGQVHAAMLAAKLVDMLVLYVAPKIVGGPAPSWVGGDGISAMAEAYGFKFDEAIAVIGGDLRLTATPVR
jgi:diaminohydroxyphosphoribosylaminopyrimidine deaminase/5-amino-6-(5-phosphoribosylamino)uracil reductase